MNKRRRFKAKARRARAQRRQQLRWPKVGVRWNYVSFLDGEIYEINITEKLW